MGDSHSFQQEKFDSIANPPFVQTSNGKIDAQSVVYKLPVELWLPIFHHCDSAIRARLVLTHVCRRWRLIAVSYPSLWTNVHIKVRNVAMPTRYKHFESLLGMQIDLSGGLPLDVVWSFNISDLYASHVLRVIRDRAPFSRWRSLELQMGGRDFAAERFLASILEFPNLESLVIFSRVDPSVAVIFCQTAMPKLQKLDLRTSDDLDREDTIIGTFCRGALSLPNSISTLHAGIREMHRFPHVLNYKLEACVFKANSFIDLRSMTNLIIDNSLHISEGRDVLLPALQYLRLMGISIALGSKIEAPVLQTLHLSVPRRCYPVYMRDAVYDNMSYAVNNPGYLLSPKRLIIQEVYLSNEEIIALLRKSRELTQATLCFNDRNSAQKVVKPLFKSGTGNAPLDDRLCPQLAELMLDWLGDDMPLSAEWLLGVLEGRKENPKRPRVSVKARQRGEEWYRHLGEW